MPGLVDTGKRPGMALGASLFTAAGDLIYAGSAGLAAILPIGSSGAVLTSSGTAPQWTTLSITQTAVVAAAVTHAQLSTTLSNVTGLVVPVGASATETWFFETYLLITAANTAVDAKFGFTVPTAATMKWGAQGNPGIFGGWGPGATTSGPVAINVQTDTLSVGSANLTFGLFLAGYIFSGGTAGNVQLQFAQNTSDASNLTIGAGSMLRYTKIVT